MRADSWSFGFRIGTTSSQRSDIFTVICREVPFRLTRSQIESDSPNYFTTAFLDGGFAESNSKIIHLDQHPRLFSLIVEHLSGYPILPLQSSTIPSFLSIEMAQESLLRDAQYFGLEGLQKAFAAYLPAPPPSPTMPETLRQRYNFDKIIEIERLIGSGDLKLTTDSSSVGIVGDTGEVLIRARNVPVRYAYDDALFGSGVADIGCSASQCKEKNISMHTRKSS